MVFIKIVLILCLGAILYQDIKERQVYWFLIPLCGLCGAILFYFKTIDALFYISIGINLIFIALLLSIIYVYTKLKLKSNFSDVFGLGDVLLFLALALSFSSISFIVLFSAALIFSLLLHLFLNKKSTSVPLAGYMSLFFGCTYLAYWMGFINMVYSI